MGAIKLGLAFENTYYNPGFVFKTHVKTLDLLQNPLKILSSLLPIKFNYMFGSTLLKLKFWERQWVRPT